MAEAVPLLIDCDTGIDDALALLYACGSPDAEIVAVTCVGGNVDARQVAANTRAVLELAGRPDVPVALGREVPLVRQLVTAPETHGPRGLGYAGLPAPTTLLDPRHASDVLVDEARRRPGELTLLTLGPLTNVAVAVLREPALPRLLRRLVMMVGSYRTPGNTAPTVEWNASVDPEALAVVLAAWAPDGPAAALVGPTAADHTLGPTPRGPGGAPVVLAAGAPDGPGAAPDLPVALGLDVTERAKLLPGHVDRLAHRAGGRDGDVMRFIEDALRFYMEFHSRYDGFYGAFIHDALALAATLDPMLVRCEAVRVEVELGGRHTTGETVADWRRSWGRPENLEVAVEARADAFFDRFIERVGWLAASRSDVAG